MRAETISKISVEYDNTHKEANIIKNDERTYWYLVSENDEGNETVAKVSAYCSDGKLLYQIEK